MQNAAQLCGATRYTRSGSWRYISCLAFFWLVIWLKLDKPPQQNESSIERACSSTMQQLRSCFLSSCCLPECCTRVLTAAASQRLQICCESRKTNDHGRKSCSCCCENRKTKYHYPVCVSTKLASQNYEKPLWNQKYHSLQNTRQIRYLWVQYWYFCRIGANIHSLRAKLYTPKTRVN